VHLGVISRSRNFEKRADTTNTHTHVSKVLLVVVEQAINFLFKIKGRSNILSAPAFVLDGLNTIFFPFCSFAVFSSCCFALGEPFDAKKYGLVLSSVVTGRVDWGELFHPSPPHCTSRHDRKVATFHFSTVSSPTTFLLLHNDVALFTQSVLLLMLVSPVDRANFLRVSQGYPGLG